MLAADRGGWRGAVGGEHFGRPPRARRGDGTVQTSYDPMVDPVFSLVRHARCAQFDSMLTAGEIAAGVDIRDAKANTPLIVAAQNGHKRMCKLVLKHGADVDAQNQQVRRRRRG